VVLTAPLAFISGCGGSPTTPPSGGGAIDVKSKMEQMQKNPEYMEKMKYKLGTPKDESKAPGVKDEPKN
jgi:hypothetical protein